MACCSLFCTCTWATSMLVPALKVSVVRELPEASLVEPM
jgi:hypothetical protein